VLRLFPLSLAAVLSIERIQLDQIGVGQNVEPVGIGEQFNAANALPNERLEPLGIPGSKESANCN